MREIKFRGKRVDTNKWIYGYYFESNGKSYIAEVHPETEYYDDYDVVENVVNESIGQYTGLKDKKGVEIYEGDILQLDEISYPVLFEDGGFQIKTSTSQGNSFAIQERVKKFVVIGNIYDNPELLEEIEVKK